jgi:hypothetical protein
MMFIVHFQQEDTGCEYSSLGCGQLVVRLPPEITTLEEADAYVCGDKVNSLKYLGLKKIKSARIYEVSNYHHVNVDHQKKLAADLREKENKKRDIAVLESLSKIKGSSIINGW